MFPIWLDIILSSSLRYSLTLLGLNFKTEIMKGIDAHSIHTHGILFSVFNEKFVWKSFLLFFSSTHNIFFHVFWIGLH